MPNTLTTIEKAMALFPHAPPVMGKAWRLAPGCSTSDYTSRISTSHALVLTVVLNSLPPCVMDFCTMEMV